MTAANVTDTLLTTATPLDDGSHKTPNATFGWGMVNAAKAVHGPAQFAFPQFGPFTAEVQEGVPATFANDIAGPGGLKLTGAGTLVLTGADTYQGGSEVAAGVLTVNGSVASDVIVDAGGTLNGNGSVGANVTNQGLLVSAGSEAGQGLSIKGSLTEGPHSTTAVALGDPLQVAGAANLMGSLTVLGAPSGYTVKATENLLTAGSVSGSFADLAFAEGVFYSGTLAYTATAVNVNLQQVSMTAAAAGLPHATAQTASSATAMQRALGVSNGWVEQGQAAGHGAWLQAAGEVLGTFNPQLATASLNSLSGEIYATGRAVETEQSLAADATIAHRQQDLAHAAAPGMWVQVLGADGRLARGSYDPATYWGSGSIVGVDGTFGDGISVGLALGRTHTSATMSALGGNLRARENVVALYARGNIGDGVYAAGRISHASVRNRVNRDVLLGSGLAALKGEHSDHVTLGTLEVGKAIGWGKATLAPYVSVSGLRLSQSSFREQGSALGLAAPSQTHDATSGTLGLRYSKGFDWSLGHTWLDGYLAYRRIFSGADLSMHASFNGVPDSSFLAEGQNLAGNVGIAGIGLNTQLNARLSWYLDAEYQAGSQGTHQVEADTGLRLAF